MASVSYRKVGDRWHIRFRAPGKKEKTKSLPGSLQERTVEKKATWYEEQIALGRENPWEETAESIKLEPAIEMYIRDGVRSGKWKVNAAGESNTANTAESRLRLLLQKVGNIDVEWLDPEEIIKWVSSRKKRSKKGTQLNDTLSPVTVKTHITTYNTFLAWLYENNRIESPKSISIPKNVGREAKQIQRQPKGISLQELDQFCKAVDKRVAMTEKQARYAKHSTVEWVAPCGRLTFWAMLRREEIINIYPEDVSTDYSYLTIGSLGGKHRPKFIPKSGIDTVPLLSKAREVLQQMDVHKMDPGKPIFDYSYDYISVAFRRICDIAFDDKRYSPHTFRHGGIIHLRSIIKQPGLVTYLARHNDQKTTDTHYGGIDPVYLRRAVEQEGL